jgi:hypothetical protein
VHRCDATFLLDIIVDDQSHRVHVIEPLQAREQLGRNVASVCSQRKHLSLVVFDFLYTKLSIETQWVDFKGGRACAYCRICFKASTEPLTGAPSAGTASAIEASKPSPSIVKFSLELTLEGIGASRRSDDLSRCRAMCRRWSCYVVKEQALLSDMRGNVKSCNATHHVRLLTWYSVLWSCHLDHKIAIEQSRGRVKGCIC